MAFDINSIDPQPGRLAVVTGANAGLGLETSKYLCRLGIKVVMACRNRAKAEAARDDIQQQQPDAELEFIELDLGSLESVRSFADELASRVDEVDLLINNAGVMWTDYSRTEDGLEGQMAANHYGHFLLTSLLLPMLPDDPASRVVSLGSIAHQQFLKRIRFEDINWDKGYNKYAAYSQSKLACILFSSELQRRLRAANRNILALCAHPGVSETQLQREMPALLHLAMRHLGGFMMHPPSQGALPTMMAALDPGLKGGEYLGPTGFMEGKGPPGVARRKPWAEDAKAAKRLWDVSVDLTGAAFNF